jgi:hypothetical protein
MCFVLFEELLVEFEVGLVLDMVIKLLGAWGLIDEGMTLFLHVYYCSIYTIFLVN